MEGAGVTGVGGATREKIRPMDQMIPRKIACDIRQQFELIKISCEKRKRDTRSSDFSNAPC